MRRTAMSGETIDSFGRTIPFNGRDKGNARSPRRSRSRERDRHWDRGSFRRGDDFVGGKPRDRGFDRDWTRFNSRMSDGGYNAWNVEPVKNQNRQFSLRDRDYFNNVPVPSQFRGSNRGARPTSPINIKPRTRLPPFPPMKSFQSFASTLSESLSSEESQIKYKQYQMEYLEDSSRLFFENSKYEEWFREKYDPLLKKKKEDEMKVHAQRESIVIATELRDDPQRCLISARLFDPNAREGGKETVPFSFHHLDGHVKRTIYLTNIPAACSRAILTNAVITEINKATVKLAQTTNSEGGTEDNSLSNVLRAAVERVSLAQPTWSHRGSHSSFSRSAWITLVDGSDISLALKALRDLRVEIPPIDLDKKSESAPGVTFRPQVGLHSVKLLNPLPDIMSNPDRIAFDLQRAQGLAALLDEERCISQEYTLESMLNFLKPEESDLSPSDKLDISVAYLRRVHFFLLYSGKSFNSEADLCSVSSSIVGRSLPPTPRDGGMSSDEKPLTDDGDDNNNGVSTYNLLDPYLGKTSHSISAVDRRVTDFILAVQTRLNNMKTGVLCSDELDANAIAEAQDEVVTEATNMNCIDLNENNKVRCAITECKKLFKGREFLKKHILNKHSELVLERLVHISEPYMQTRYKILDVTDRQLPPIVIEGWRGNTEEHSAKEIRDMVLSKAQVPETTHNNGRAEKRSLENLGSYEKNDRQFIPKPPPFQPPTEDVRTLNAYRDVDAPIAVSCVDSKFGVSLPPPKKRKIVIKKRTSSD